MPTDPLPLLPLSSPPTVPVSLLWPQDLLDQVQRLATLNGTTFEAFVEDAVRRHAHQAQRDQELMASLMEWGQDLLRGSIVPSAATDGDGTPRTNGTVAADGTRGE